MRFLGCPLRYGKNVRGQRQTKDSEKGCEERIQERRIKEAIRGAKISPGVDPPGSAGVHSWGPIARRYRLSLTVVNEDG